MTSIIKKKVILFIVEGITDQESLALILYKLIDSHTVKFHIVGGDICSDYFTNPQNAPVKIHEQVKTFINKNRYLPGDLLKIVHLIDTDGTFIPPAAVIEAPVSETNYYSNRIETANRGNIIERNKRKSAVVARLFSTTHISRIPYQMFYFSSCLEHVLHDKQCLLTDSEKMRLADQFVDRFEDNPGDFLTFISDPEFAVPGTYPESWNYIQDGLNSLKRKCNFHIYFE